MGRTLTATLTRPSLISARPRVRPPQPRLPKTLPAAPPPSPAPAPALGPDSTAQPLPSGPASEHAPRAAPAVIRAPRFSGARAARRGGAGVPWEPVRGQKSGSSSLRAAGDGAISRTPKTQPHSLKKLGGGRRRSSQQLGPAQEFGHNPEVKLQSVIFQP